MEPYRGFPQFMEAVALIQQQRPNCHVVIAGEDRVAYGKSLPDGKTYKQLMLETLDLDLSRIHFTGSLPYAQYLQLLQASSAHIYLTRPFVLSWSMLEAMSTGCVVIGSDTAPCQRSNSRWRKWLAGRFLFTSRNSSKSKPSFRSSSIVLNRFENKLEKLFSKNTILEKLLPQHIDWLSQGLKSSKSNKSKPLGFGTKSAIATYSLN